MPHVPVGWFGCVASSGVFLHTHSHLLHTPRFACLSSFIADDSITRLTMPDYSLQQIHHFTLEGSQLAELVVGQNALSSLYFFSLQSDSCEEGSR